mgnify:CR=1 FL=1
MNININNDFDLNIEKLNEMLNKLQLLEDKSKLLRFVTIDEFSKIRNCSKVTAQRIFRQKSFPSERVSVNKK